jgi:hypothetical protein
VGYTGISVAFDQTSSATGPRDFNFLYSLDGSSFTPVGSSYIVLTNGTSLNNELSGLSTAPWSSTTSQQSAYTHSYDLSAITALNGASSVFFRIAMADTVAGNGGTVGTGGTDRLDNVIVSGTSTVPEPTSLAIIGLGALGLRLLRRKP